MCIVDFVCKFIRKICKRLSYTAPNGVKRSEEIDVVHKECARSRSLTF